MNEPDNHTAVVDRFGGTWVRTDDMPGAYGPWWPICDGPGFEPAAHTTVGTAREWAEVEEYGPFTAADPDRTAAAIALVRQAVAA